MKLCVAPAVTVAVLGATAIDVVGVMCPVTVKEAEPERLSKVAVMIHVPALFTCTEFDVQV